MAAIFFNLETKEISWKPCTLQIPFTKEPLIVSLLHSIWNFKKWLNFQKRDDTNPEIKNCQKMSEKLEKTTEKFKTKYLKHDLQVGIMQKTIPPSFFFPITEKPAAYLL